MTDLGAAAQKAAEDRLEACYEELSEDDDDSLFCGCITCIVREVLDAAVPILFGVHPPD